MVGQWGSRPLSAVQATKGLRPDVEYCIAFMEEPMLLLSRKVGEEIVLPTCGVSIIVARLTKNRVSLCITAPDEVPIYRAEIMASDCGLINGLVGCPAEPQEAVECERR